MRAFQTIRLLVLKVAVLYLLLVSHNFSPALFAGVAHQSGSCIAWASNGGQCQVVAILRWGAEGRAAATRDDGRGPKGRDAYDARLNRAGELLH